MYWHLREVLNYMFICCVNFFKDSLSAFTEKSTKEIGVIHFYLSSLTCTYCLFDVRNRFNFNVLHVFSYIPLSFHVFRLLILGTKKMLV